MVTYDLDVVDREDSGQAMTCPIFTDIAACFDRSGECGLRKSRGRSRRRIAGEWKRPLSSDQVGRIRRLATALEPRPHAGQHSLHKNCTRGCAGNKLKVNIKRTSRPAYWIFCHRLGQAAQVLGVLRKTIQSAAQFERGHLSISRS